MSESTDQKPLDATVGVPKTEAKASELDVLLAVDAPSLAPSLAPSTETVVPTLETSAPQAIVVEIKPVETKPAETNVADGKLVEAKAAEDKPSDVQPAETKSVESNSADAKPSDVRPAQTEAAKPDVKLASWIARTPASTRFRESASAQIAAARERITQRNLSGAMTMALAVGVLSAGVAGGGGYLAGLSERSTTHAMALEQSVLRIEAEMALLRGEMERASRSATASADETGERLERIEKAQAEPLLKLSKLAEMVEKLRSMQASTLAAAKIDASDVTGSVNRSAAKSRPAASTVVEAWVLREFDKDVALIEGKRGLLEIAVGDDIPGVGRVEGFRKHDGHWAVVTSKGLITTR